jgi:hypothetical protein
MKGASFLPNLSSKASLLSLRTGEADKSMKGQKERKSFERSRCTKNLQGSRHCEASPILGISLNRKQGDDLFEQIQN